MKKKKVKNIKTNDYHKVEVVISHLCPYGERRGIICTAPNTQCPHWQGIFCEMDEWDRTDRPIKGGTNE